MSPELKVRLLVALLALGASIVLGQFGLAFAGEPIGQTTGPL